MDSDREPRSIEVVYATPDEQRIVTLDRTDGMTAGEAVRASGLLDAFPEIAERPLVLGIFGERAEPDRILADGDRIEICRPLLRDPRTLRRELSALGQVMGIAGRAPGRGDTASSAVQEPRHGRR